MYIYQKLHFLKYFTTTIKLFNFTALKLHNNLGWSNFLFTKL